MNCTFELCACRGPDDGKGSDEEHSIWDGSGD